MVLVGLDENLSTKTCKMASRTKVLAVTNNTYQYKRIIIVKTTTNGVLLIGQSSFTII